MAIINSKEAGILLAAAEGRNTPYDASYIRKLAHKKIIRGRQIDEAGCWVFQSEDIVQFAKQRRKQKPNIEIDKLDNLINALAQYTVERD